MAQELESFEVYVKTVETFVKIINEPVVKTEILFTIKEFNVDTSRTNTFEVNMQ